MCKPLFEVFFNFFALFFPESGFSFPQKIKLCQGFFIPSSRGRLPGFMSTFPGVSFLRFVHTRPRVSFPEKSNISPIYARSDAPFSSLCTTLFAAIYTGLLVYKQTALPLYRFKAFYPLSSKHQTSVLASAAGSLSACLLFRPPSAKQRSRGRFPQGEPASMFHSEFMLHESAG